MKFSQLGLSEPLARATDALGYHTATPIQVQAIPAVLAGRDLMGCAQTGTGKTAAFTLPMLNRLTDTPRSQTNRAVNDKARPFSQKHATAPPRALVLAPTRELAAQIEGSIHRYGRHTSIRQTVIVGGVSQHQQVTALRRGVDVVVATPGRLIDLMDQGHVDISKIEILVFDEADQMLDMGFLPALQRIVAAVPAKRQTLMFSATMPDKIRSLAQQWLTNPVSIQVANVSAPAERIAHSVHLVDKKRKPDLLSRFLQETPRSRTLVFSRTKYGADKIVKRLNRDGLPAVAIHGNKSQGARNLALAKFKGTSPPVLVATDIAARGLDIENVSHVVNFDLPETPETYVHRIGRTARAGATGVAVSFCSGDERGLLRQIEQLTKLTIEVEATIDGFEPTEPVNNGPGRLSNRQSPKKGLRQHRSKTASNGASIGRKRTQSGASRMSAVAGRPRRRRQRRALSA